MNKTLSFALVLLFLPITTISLFGQLTIDAEIRPRGEFRNGFKKPRSETADPAFFIEQRSRLYFGYRSEKINLQFDVQDIRIWGNADQIYKQDPALTNLNEAWGEYWMGEKFAFKAGRQEIDYDNARFLGDLRWAAQSRSHDAILFKIKDDSTG